jgi:hypothetical protein
MSFYRATLVAMATLFALGLTSLGLTSAAFAGCGGCGGWTGCGGGAGWGTGCGSAVPVATYEEVPVTTYAQPIAPAPIQVGGCGCGASGLFTAAPWVAPQPLYVVNQGPDYTGPGLMEPYRTYNPAPLYAPTSSYPYVSGYHRHGYWGARYASGEHAFHHGHGSGFYQPGPRWHVYR